PQDAAHFGQRARIVAFAQADADFGRTLGVVVAEHDDTEAFCERIGNLRLYGLSAGHWPAPAAALRAPVPPAAPRPCNRAPANRVTVRGRGRGPAACHARSRSGARSPPARPGGCG